MSNSAIDVPEEMAQKKPRTLGRRNGASNLATYIVADNCHKSKETDPQKSLVDCALFYASMGLRVFPCHSIRNGSCSCGNVDCSSAAKHPRVSRSVHDATTDEKQIRSWWQR